MKNKPNVNILILNWNGSKVLESCVESVMLNNYSNFDTSMFNVDVLGIHINISS